MEPTITLSPLEIVAIRQWVRSYQQFHGPDETLQGLDAKVVAAVGQATAPALTPPTRCLTTGCPRKVSCRGLCQDCYAHYHRLVKRGQTSWERLESKGLVLPTAARCGGA